MGVARVRWGVLSTARHQPQVLAGRARVRPVEVVAVASRDAGARRGLRARARDRARLRQLRGAARGSGRRGRLHLAAELACTVEWSISALEAGKHVLCEKPLSRHPEDVERAFDAAERAGRLLMEAFMYRHNPQTKRLTELVDGGAIGELRLVRAAFSSPLYDAENVRLRADARRRRR